MPSPEERAEPAGQPAELWPGQLWEGGKLHWDRHDRLPTTLPVYAWHPFGVLKVVTPSLSECPGLGHILYDQSIPRSLFVLRFTFCSQLGGHMGS